jgi:hypothetical protein
MVETKRQEHDRLQRRTDELKQEHADLSRDTTPFNQADHDGHQKNLREHKKHLADHKLRSEGADADLERERLEAEFAALLDEHLRLMAAPYDAAEHEAHRAKLRHMIDSLNELHDRLRQHHRLVLPREGAR